MYRLVVLMSFVSNHYTLKAINISTINERKKTNCVKPITNKESKIIYSLVNSLVSMSNYTDVKSVCIHMTKHRVSSA